MYIYIYTYNLNLLNIRVLPSHVKSFSKGTFLWKRQGIASTCARQAGNNHVTKLVGILQTSPNQAILATLNMMSNHVIHPILFGPTAVDFRTSVDFGLGVGISGKCGAHASFVDTCGMCLADANRLDRFDVALLLLMINDII